MISLTLLHQCSELCSAAAKEMTMVDWYQRLVIELGSNIIGHYYNNLYVCRWCLLSAAEPGHLLVLIIY